MEKEFNKIKKIIENKNHIPITIMNRRKKIKTIYVFKSRTKNFIFYTCNNRKKWTDKGKVNIQKKIFIITEDCNYEEPHKNIEYNEFVELLKKNDINNIDFKQKYIQKYYVEYQINQNKNIDNPALKNNFYLLTTCKLDLSKSNLSRIRSKIIDTYKDLNLEELINKIIENDNDLINYTIDIHYEYSEPRYR